MCPSLCYNSVYLNALLLRRPYIQAFIELLWFSFPPILLVFYSTLCVFTLSFPRDAEACVENVHHYFFSCNECRTINTSMIDRNITTSRLPPFYTESCTVQKRAAFFMRTGVDICSIWSYGSSSVGLDNMTFKTQPFMVHHFNRCWSLQDQGTTHKSHNVMQSKLLLHWSWLLPNLKIKWKVRNLSIRFTDSELSCVEPSNFFKSHSLNNISKRCSSRKSTSCDCVLQRSQTCVRKERNININNGVHGHSRGLATKMVCFSEKQTQTMNTV